MSEPATPINVTVTFQPGTASGFTYSHSSPPAGVSFSTPPAKVKLRRNTAPGVSNNFAIIFELKAAPEASGTLVWDTQGGPILWMSGSPPALETGFHLPEPEDNKIVVGVHNSNTTPEHEETYGFRLKVIYDGQHVESPDPEIILDPPTP